MKDFFLMLRDCPPPSAWEILVGPHWKSLRGPPTSQAASKLQLNLLYKLYYTALLLRVNSTYLGRGHHKNANYTESWILHFPWRDKACQWRFTGQTNLSNNDMNITMRLKIRMQLSNVNQHLFITYKKKTRATSKCTGFFWQQTPCHLSTDEL